jgi:hypothetical protein
VQPLFLRVDKRLAIVASLGVALATSCQNAWAPEPPLIPAPNRSIPTAVSTTGPDTSCDRRSGIAFRLQMQTLRAFGNEPAYGREAVSASFGEGRQRQDVPGFVLWLASVGKMGGLPNYGIYPTDSSGSLPVKIVVVDTSALNPLAQPMGSAKLELPLRRHWVWWVSSTIAPRRDREGDEVIVGPPAHYAVTALPGGDSLYVTVYGSPRRCGLYLN